MDTLTNITTSLLQITVIAILIIGIWLIVVAGKTLVSARAIRIQDIATIIVILSLILLAVAVYPAALMKSATNGINAMTNESPAFTESVGKLINAVIEPWQGGDENPPVTISQPTPQFTSTPMPTIDNHFEATATAYFEGTAMPSEPTVTPTWSNQDFVDFATTMATKYPTPKPTIFVCQKTEDHALGCLPPTPIPGG